MAVNKVVYSGDTLMDLTSDTVTSENLDEGITAHNSAGESIVGVRRVVDVLPIENGGTGATTASDALTKLGAAAVNHDHTGYASSTHDHSASDITSGTLSVNRGGTGRSTLTSGYFLRGNGTSAVTMSSAASARNAMGLGNTTGALPIANGGTGATTANAAANNLCEVGTWTPTLTNASGAWPSYTYAWNYGYYVKIGRLVWVSCDIAPGISSIGGNYAQISGLPYASDGYHGLVMTLCYQVCNSVSESISPVACTDGTNVRIYTPNGVSSYNWMVNTSVGTNAGRLRFSGVYRTS